MSSKGIHDRNYTEVDKLETYYYEWTRRVYNSVIEI